MALSLAALLSNSVCSKHDNRFVPLLRVLSYFLSPLYLQIGVWLERAGGCSQRAAELFFDRQNMVHPKLV